MTTDRRVADILAELRSLGSAKNRAGMARYGINVENAFGVSIYELRRVAKRLGTDHELALALWATGNHEARLLACFVDDPAAVTEEQTEAWAGDFDSWDICDQATTSLFDLTEHAWAKATEWAVRDEEWVERGGFALMAGLAVHDKVATDRAFMRLLPLIERAASDDRNFVKKAVNWALRNIGKRNRALNAAAIACAEKIRAAANRRAGGDRGGDRGGDPQARSARWVATDALRELGSDKIQERLKGSSLATRQKKPAAAMRRPPGRAGEEKTATRKPAPRADFGAPIDRFFQKQPPRLRAILEELRRLVEEAAPDARSSIKWGMPFYTVNGTMMCALGGHKAHVNLVLAGPPSTFADAEGRLLGDGGTGRHLKVTTLAELPHESVRRWLRTAAGLARKKS